LVVVEGLSKAELVGESLLDLPIPFQNFHYPQNHVDFKKRKQIDEIIHLGDFHIKLRNKRIMRII